MVLKSKKSKGKSVESPLPMIFRPHQDGRATFLKKMSVRTMRVFKFLVADFGF
jgi:hypothetical protein